jgi:hypothetical protein
MSHKSALSDGSARLKSCDALIFLAAGGPLPRAGKAYLNAEWLGASIDKKIAPFIQSMAEPSARLLRNFPQFILQIR